MTGGGLSLLGVVLAGGESSRFGSPKAVFPLGGRPMASWGIQALRARIGHVVLISNDPETGPRLDLPFRSDLQPGMGPMAGLETALAWAGEGGFDGVFLLGCDLPLVDEDLLSRILESGFRGRAVLVPESPGPLGLEPLCAAYTLECLGPVRDLLQAGRRSMMSLLDGVGYARVPADELGGGDVLARAFMNVNTPEEAVRVGAVLAGDGAPE